jgi:hypothetical protein
MMNLVSRAISICQNDHPAGSGFPHDGGNSRRSQNHIAPVPREKP